MATLAASLSLSQGLGLLDATVLGIVASSAALVPRPAMACHGLPLTRPGQRSQKTMGNHHVFKG